MEEDRPEFIQMLIESEIKFVAQFDPESESFHKGDPTPVPLGGERVPMSMPTAYDNSGTCKDTPMDPDYYFLVEVRTQMMEFKKVLSQICPAVETVLRAKRFKDEGKKIQALSERTQALFNLLNQASLMYSQLRSFGEVSPNYDEMMKEIFNRATLEYGDKKEYAEFMLFMTACSQRVFKDSQNIMQRLKNLN
jgi:hypothetical protein